jgi:tetratricopeptide (TPR) repeat protein
MSEGRRFKGEKAAMLGFQPVKSTYTVREITHLFGLSERYVRKWTQEGLIVAGQTSDEGELLFDFQALTRFRLVRDLRARGMSDRQIDAELRGQINLFQPEESQLLFMPSRLTPFEEGLSLQGKDDDRAAACFRSAIEAGDHAADAYCNLGILEYEAGRPVASLDCLTRALLADPRHFESHYNLGNLYFENGDLRLARLHYEFAGELEPAFPHLHFNHGLLLAMLGEYEAAEKALRLYRELEPDECAEEVEELLENLQSVLACQDERPN